MTVGRTQISLSLIFGLFAWLLLLSALTVYNSYYDKDEGPAIGLETPPKAEISMLIGAWALKIWGLIIALFLNQVFIISYIAGVILSVLYSHKKFRFKSNGYMAVFFNFIMGAATFIAIASFASHISAPALYAGSFAAGFFGAAIYLFSQLPQQKEDKKRGDVSVAIIHGEEKTLAGAVIFITLGFMLGAIALIDSGLNAEYLAALVIYFFFILGIGAIWVKRRNKPISDFKTMNKLTLGISYAGNAAMIVIYILEVLR